MKRLVLEIRIAADSINKFAAELQQATVAVRRFKAAANKRRVYSRHSKRWIKFL